MKFLYLTWANLQSFFRTTKSKFMYTLRFGQAPSVSDYGLLKLKKRDERQFFYVFSEKKFIDFVAKTFFGDQLFFRKKFLFFGVKSFFLPHDNISKFLAQRNLIISPPRLFFGDQLFFGKKFLVFGVKSYFHFFLVGGSTLSGKYITMHDI